jgi:hypothetical protein
VRKNIRLAYFSDRSMTFLRFHVNNYKKWLLKYHWNGLICHWHEWVRMKGKKRNKKLLNFLIFHCSVIKVFHLFIISLLYFFSKKLSAFFLLRPLAICGGSFSVFAAEIKKVWRGNDNSLTAVDIFFFSYSLAQKIKLSVFAQLKKKRDAKVERETLIR